MKDNIEILVKEKEMKYLDSNHDDTLIVSISMINAWVKRVMIDTNNSINILYFDSF